MGSLLGAAIVGWGMVLVVVINVIVCVCVLGNEEADPADVQGLSLQ